MGPLPVLAELRTSISEYLLLHSSFLRGYSVILEINSLMGWLLSAMFRMEHQQQSDYKLTYPCMLL